MNSRPIWKSTQLLLAAALLLFGTPLAHAHVGSKDVFETLQAGPYRLFITVRMPNVIPGIATVEVEADSSSAALQSLEITPTPLTGEASLHPPAPDHMQPDPADPRHFTGQLWIMAAGSWQVRFHAAGTAGEGIGSVPVAAVPLRVLPMDHALGWLLAFLGTVLAVGFAGLIAAAVGESRLAPGLAVDSTRRARARFAFIGGIALAAALATLGGWWWHIEAVGYAAAIYKPASLTATLSDGVLHLALGETDRKTGEFLPLNTSRLLLDHNKVMHLYAIRWPQMDAAFHLHPVVTGKGLLAETLPAMPPGDYKLFADIVLASGFPETPSTMLTIPPGATSAPLAADDASAFPQVVSGGLIGPDYKLPDGYTLHWEAPAALTANRAYQFHFTLLDPAGHPAVDTVPYLGMAGHAAFVKTDGKVFAHTHPEGSAAMPAMMMANPTGMSAMDSPAAAVIPPAVDCPYGFPSPGRYRIFVQMKHGTTVETGVFDASVN